MQEVMGRRNKHEAFQLKGPRVAFSDVVRMGLCHGLALEAYV